MLPLLRASRQMTDLAGQMRNDIRPLIEKATRLTDEASRVTSMAVVQMERVDKLTLLVATRLDETMGVLAVGGRGPGPAGAQRSWLASKPWWGPSASGKTARAGPTKTKTPCSSDNAHPMTAAACRRPLALLLAAALMAGVTVGAQAPSAASESGAKAKELAALLQAKKLEAFAARDAMQPGRYVAAIVVPGVQLLVVSASYSRTNDIEYSLYNKKFQDAYLDLKSGALSTDRFFVDDAHVRWPGGGAGQESAARCRA